MPSYDVNIPGQGKYRVNSPTDLTNEQVWVALQGQLGSLNQTPDVASMSTEELEKAPSAPTSISDIARSFGIGAVGGVKSLADVFGAGSDTSEYLGEKLKSLQSGITPARQAEIARRQELEKRAAESGDTFKEFKTFLGGVAEAPIQSAFQGVGSSVPTAALALAAIPAGAPATLALGVGIISKYAIGAAQGVGELKGSIFDEVQQAYVKAGYSKDEATELALKAQEYSADKAMELGGAALLGALDAGTGIESGITKAARAAAAKKIAGESTKSVVENISGAALTRPGVIGSAIRSAAGEAPLEGAQGGFGEYAKNLALIKEGLLDPELAMQGVYGAAARDAAVGALTGGAFTPVVQANRMREYQADQFLRQEKALAEEQSAPPALPTNITEMPEGYSVMRQEVGKDYIPSFNIMAPGAENPLATVDTEEEAQKRLQRYTEIRQEEREKYNDQLEKIDDGVQKMQTKLDYMEATQQTDSEEYQQLKANFPAYMEDAAQKKTDLLNKIEAFGQPLQITPAGQTEQVQEQFTVRDKSGQPIQSFNTMGEAEAFVRDTVGEKPFKAAQQRSQDMKALEENLTTAMRGFGLKDVAFKLVDKIERNAAGAYGNKLIRVVMDDKNPLQTMRHESVHALKDLGFFTPQQWKALESRAKNEWVKTYLEASQTEIDGQQMSRLEGYRKLGYTEDVIIEEAIADAFAAYDKGQTPPPGLIASLFKRLKEFFARLKQAMNGAGFQTADDIFQSIERGELKPSLKGAAPSTETKYSKKPSSVQEVIDDGVKRLVESARKSRLNTLEERYDVGLSRANSNLNKIEDGILNRLKDLGVSTERDADGNREIDDVFYNKILPAVRSVLKKEERYSLNKPSSDIGHKRVANSGRYVGAPDWVGSSPQQLTNLRKKLLRLAKEGEAGKYWYENSSKAILELAGGDKKEAEKIVGLIAIYSPNNTVPGNTSMALNAYYQYKTGQTISAGLSDADKKADELLNQNKPWGGIKTNSFYQNLMVSIDPSKLDQGVATMDMWMAFALRFPPACSHGTPVPRLLCRPSLHRMCTIWGRARVRQRASSSSHPSCGLTSLRLRMERSRPIWVARLRRHLRRHSS